jgi:hypothetical protein
MSAHGLRVVRAHRRSARARARKHYDARNRKAHLRLLDLVEHLRELPGAVAAPNRPPAPPLREKEAEAIVEPGSGGGRRGRGYGARGVAGVQAGREHLAERKRHRLPRPHDIPAMHAVTP